MSEPVDYIKKRQLRKHKAIATGLFLLMVLVYSLTVWLLKARDNTVLEYIRAFSEAGMVGALADWFAVTALFHHPLGIPIPHTNLIENKKKNIGDNLGGFVVSNFLNAATIRPYISKVQVSNLLVQWLDHSKNVSALVAEVLKILNDIVKKADDKAVSQFIARQSQKLLKEIQWNTVLASGLEILKERGDHTRILNYLITRLRNYIVNNEEMIRERVKKESHFLIPGFVDNLIAAKITKGLYTYLSEIEQEAHHPIRKEIDQQLNKFISDMKSSPAWQKELDDIKNSLLSGDKMEQYASSVWKHLQKAIVKDLETEPSSIAAYLEKSIEEMVTNLKNNPGLQQKLNNWAQRNAYKYILKNTSKVGELISSTVGNWQGKELSNKLELEVGKDLQFIRINGTLVGGLVGLLIHAITQWIENGSF